MRNNKCKKIGFFKWSTKRNDSLKPFQVLNSLEFPLNKLIIQKNYAISLNGKISILIINNFLENNEAFLWGSLTENKDRDFLNMLPSKIIMNPRDKSIRKIVTNNSLIYLLTENGNIYCYGSSDYGLLGMGPDIISAKKPILLEYFCKNNIFITEMTLSDKMGAATNVTGQIFVWGTNIDQNLINEPTFLLNYDKKIVRLETTNYFLYVLNDEGALYFFKHKVIIKNSECNFTKCKYLQNQNVIEINTNKSDDNLVCCLTKEGNIFLINNDESSLQIPNNFDVLYYSMNFFNDRILCFGMSYNETYFFEWKLKKEQSKTLLKLYKGFIYKILDNNIDYISLIPSFSTNIISFIYDEKNNSFKTLKNNLNILLDDEKPNFFKSFKEKEKDCLNYEFLEEIDMEKIKKNYHCQYDIDQIENKENEEMNYKLNHNKQSKIEYEISLLKQSKIKRNLSQEKYDQIKAQTTQILMKNINNKEKKEKKFKNFEILFKFFQKTIDFLNFSQRKFVFQKILKKNKLFKKQKKYSLKILIFYQKNELNYILDKFYQYKQQNNLLKINESKNIVKNIKIFQYLNYIFEKKKNSFFHYTFFKFKENSIYETKNLLKKFHNYVFLSMSLKSEIYKYVSHIFQKIKYYNKEKSKNFKRRMSIFTKIVNARITTNNITFFCNLKLFVSIKRSNNGKIQYMIKLLENIYRNNYKFFFSILFNNKSAKKSKNNDKNKNMPLNNSLYQNENLYSFSKNEFSDFSYKMPSKLNADRENNHLKISKEIPQKQKNSSSKAKKKDVLKDIDKWIIDERKKIEQLKYFTKEMNSSKKKKNSVKSLSRSKSARSTQLQLQMINDIHTKVEKLNKIFNKKKNLKIDNYDKPNPSCLKSLKTKSKSRSNSKSKEKKYKYR